MLISFCLRWKRCSLSAHWQASWLAQLQLFSGWIFSLRHLVNTHPHVLFSGCALVTTLSSASWHPAKVKYHSSELQECRDLHNEKHLLIHRYFADIYIWWHQRVWLWALYHDGLEPLLDVGVTRIQLIFLKHAPMEWMWSARRLPSLIIAFTRCSETLEPWPWT